MSIQVDPKYLATLEKAIVLGGLSHVSGLSGDERSLLVRRIPGAYDSALSIVHPRIIHHGIAAHHTQACAVRHSDSAAVFDCNNGVFHPSWAAQSHGWRLVQAKTRWQRFLLKIGFGEKF